MQSVKLFWLSDVVILAVDVKVILGVRATAGSAYGRALLALALTCQARFDLTSDAVTPGAQLLRQLL